MTWWATGASMLASNIQTNKSNRASDRLAKSLTEGGQGGPGSGLSALEQDINLGLGDREPARQGLLGITGKTLLDALLGGGEDYQADLTKLASSVGLGYDQSRLMLQDRLQNVANIGGGEAARARSLDQMRQRAMPQQQRAVDAQLNNLFGTGRLGTTGGANVIGRLAEAQDQQDLGFQLAAAGEGRTEQSLADQLAGTAFGRFGSLGQDFGGVNQRRFDRRGGLLNLQGVNLDQALGALGGMGAMDTGLLQMLQSALAPSQIQGNFRMGTGSNLVNAMGDPRYGGNSQQAKGSGLEEIANSMGGGGGGGGKGGGSDGSKYWGLTNAAPDGLKYWGAQPNASGGGWSQAAGLNTASTGKGGGGGWQSMFTK